MAKSKNRHAKGQQQGLGDPKKRKMQQFQRVSMSSQPGASSRENDPAGKKRKLADTTAPLTSHQQQQAWKNKKTAKNTHQQEIHQRPTIPYHKKDRILLIGEGELICSFACPTMI